MLDLYTRGRSVFIRDTPGTVHRVQHLRTTTMLLQLANRDSARVTTRLEPVLFHIAHIGRDSQRLVTDGG